MEVTWGTARLKVVFARRRRLPPLRLVTSAHAFVFDEGRLLLTKLKAGGEWRPGWDVPGGRIRTGETPIAALHRECLEEAGVTLDNVGLFGTLKLRGLDAAPPLGHAYPWPVSYIAIYVASAREYQDLPDLYEAEARGAFAIPEAVRILREEKGDPLLACLVGDAFAFSFTVIPKRAGEPIAPRA
ncbi:MAG: NUDIX domain-containing protein [Chloroflexi bacterium]|nr:NUDIX domain-containing protein [Chloroflexota bacterium]